MLNRVKENTGKIDIFTKKIKAVKYIKIYTILTKNECNQYKNRR